MLLSSALIFFSLLLIPFISAAGNSFQTYPDKLIPTNHIDGGDSLRVTSIPKAFNLTLSNNKQHFLIYDNLKFDPELAYYCLEESIVLTFIKENSSENIYGYCFFEIEADKEFLFPKCQKQLIKKNEMSCDNIQKFVDEYENRMSKTNPKFPKDETANVTTVVDINYFLLFIIFVFAVSFGSLMSDIIRYIFFTHVQPRLRNRNNNGDAQVRYIAVPKENENGEQK